MKKLFLTMVTALMSATMSFAQTSVIATLNHEGAITVFGGSSALQNAMTAAVTGDIITLSSGSFNGVTIDKAVTLRGAGMETDTINGVLPTIIDGNLSFNTSEPNLSVEGIKVTGTTSVGSGTLTDAIFQKCHFSRFDQYSNTYNRFKNVTFLHCNIAGPIELHYANGTVTGCSVSFINCRVNTPYQSSTGCTSEFTNCYIYLNPNKTAPKNAIYTNCIINATNSTSLPDSPSMFSYCAAFLKDGADAFAGTQSVSCISISDAFYSVIKEGSFYELRDEVKNIYVGNDGTEMGLYGGNVPYETRILSPQITRCNVASKTTADGKLSVDIEVRAVE